MARRTPRRIESSWWVASLRQSAKALTACRPESARVTFASVSSELPQLELRALASAEILEDVQPRVPVGRENQPVLRYVAIASEGVTSDSRPRVDHRFRHRRDPRRDLL